MIMRPPSPQVTCSTLIFLQLLIYSTPLGAAALSSCDFELYESGCFSQANLICDHDTSLCKCHPGTPVLINQRLCVRRAKAYEACEFAEQCDTANGYLCLDAEYRLVNSTLNREAPFKCRSIKAKPFKYPKQTHQQQQSLSLSTYSYPASSISPSQTPTRQSQNNFLSSSGLPRLIWIVLLACLLGLIVLLILIKSQYYRLGRSFHHHNHQADDRISINSELDVPPPYEVAIRMKL